MFSLESCATLSSLGKMPQEDASLPSLDSVNTLVDVSSVGFEWKLITDSRIKGFVIYRAQNNKDEALQKIATIKDPFSTHYFDTKLKPQTKYTYAFATLGANNTISPKSNPIPIQTSYIDPVESIFAINNRPKTIKLIWSPHPNPSIKSYLIERLNNAGEFQTIKTIPHRLSVEYFDTDLKDGVTYTYRIVAKSYEGVRAKPSQSISITTIQQPNPITNIQATTDLPKAVKIKWDEAPDAEGVKIKRYKILYSKNGKDFKSLATTTQTSYTHKLKDDGESYIYQVVLLGENELEGKMSSYPPRGSSLNPPKAPTMFEGKMQNQQAHLQWKASTDERVKYYAIYRKEKQLWKQALRFTDITDTYFIDKEMQPNKKYLYSVVGVDEHEIESAHSQEIELSLEP